YNFLDVAFYASIALGVYELGRLLKVNSEDLDSGNSSLDAINPISYRRGNIVGIAAFLALSAQEIMSGYEYTRNIIESVYWKKLTYDPYDIAAYALGFIGLIIINKLTSNRDNRNLRSNLRFAGRSGTIRPNRRISSSPLNIKVSDVLAVTVIAGVLSLAGLTILESTAVLGLGFVGLKLLGKSSLSDKLGLVIGVGVFAAIMNMAGIPVLTAFGITSLGLLAKAIFIDSVKDKAMVQETKTPAQNKDYLKASQRYESSQARQRLVKEIRDTWYASYSSTGELIDSSNSLDDLNRLPNRIILRFTARERESVTAVYKGIKVAEAGISQAMMKAGELAMQMIPYPVMLNASSAVRNQSRFVLHRGDASEKWYNRIVDAFMQEDIVRANHLRQKAILNNLLDSTPELKGKVYLGNITNFRIEEHIRSLQFLYNTVLKDASMDSIKLERYFVDFQDIANRHENQEVGLCGYILNLIEREKIRNLFTYIFTEEAEQEIAHDPIRLAAKMVVGIIRIQPFDNANHRSSDFIMHFILLKNGLPPFYLYSDNVIMYYKLLNTIDLRAGNYDLDVITEFFREQINRNSWLISEEIEASSFLTSSSAASSSAIFSAELTRRSFLKILGYSAAAHSVPGFIGRALAQSESGERFDLVVGSYAEKANALERQKEIVKLGYEAYLDGFRSNGQHFTRVVLALNMTRPQLNSFRERLVIKGISGAESTFAIIRQALDQRGLMGVYSYIEGLNRNLLDRNVIRALIITETDEKHYIDLAKKIVNRSRDDAVGASQVTPIGVEEINRKLKNWRSLAEDGRLHQDENNVFAVVQALVGNTVNRSRFETDMLYNIRVGSALFLIYRNHFDKKRLVKNGKDYVLLNRSKAQGHGFYFEQAAIAAYHSGIAKVERALKAGPSDWVRKLGPEGVIHSARFLTAYSILEGKVNDPKYLMRKGILLEMLKKNGYNGVDVKVKSAGSSLVNIDSVRLFSGLNRAGPAMAINYQLSGIVSGISISSSPVVLKEAHILV
ncbi:MAG: SPOR domain-containing protein, partial [Candidatus Omnitrophica bacterium]|nr:SPOR domain-containing protein [Candidatus Omnitrophota bacterium]